MGVWSLLLRGLLFSFFVSISAGAAPFKIAPYVYLKDKTYEVAWQYANNSQVQRQTLTNDTCGLGQNLSYQIPGMEMPVNVGNIPCPDEGLPVRFSFMADTQEGLETDAKFTDLIQKMNTQAVILGGDLVQEGSEENLWVGFFATLAKLTSDHLLIPVVGNHEYRKDPQAKGWKRYFNKDASYAFNSLWLGPVHLIILNSSFEDDPTLLIRQLAFAIEELGKPAAWKVLVFHHPPFSRSVMLNPTYPRKEYKDLRDFYLPIFELFGADLVLNGHTHMYEHSFQNGIHYVTTGAAGGVMGIVGKSNKFELVFEHTRSFIQIQASSRELFLDAIDINGNTIDKLVLKK